MSIEKKVNGFGYVSFLKNKGIELDSDLRKSFNEYTYGIKKYIEFGTEADYALFLRNNRRRKQSSKDAFMKYVSVMPSDEFIVDIAHKLALSDKDKSFLDYIGLGRLDKEREYFSSLHKKALDSRVSLYDCIDDVKNILQFESMNDMLEEKDDREIFTELTFEYNNRVSSLGKIIDLYDSYSAVNKESFLEKMSVDIVDAYVFVVDNLKSKFLMREYHRIFKKVIILEETKRNLFSYINEELKG